jgi:hypothetical protein
MLSIWMGSMNDIIDKAIFRSARAIFKFSSQRNETAAIIFTFA